MKIVSKAAILLLLYAFSPVSAIGMNTGFMKARHTLRDDGHEKAQASTEQSKGDLPDAPIYFQSWIRYFRYKELNGHSKPTSFYLNPAFSTQQKSDKQTDQWGPFMIPGKNDFFGVLGANQLNILSSRQNAVAKIIDTLNVEFIRVIPEDDNFAGGVQDFGQFDEGYCFKVSTVVPKVYYKMTFEEPEPADGFPEDWVICTQHPDAQVNMMNALIKLKLKKQHKLGYYMNTPQEKTPDKPKSMVQGETAGQAVTQATGSPDAESKNVKAQDGRWVLLKDWGECSLKCGGGKQYKQKMCIPPKFGGKACEGESIEERECNTQPCPTAAKMLPVIEARKKNGGSTGQKFLKPIVKIMPLTSRPQRYDKCHLKEGDAIMGKLNSKGEMERLPVRIILNNKSFAVFTDESMSTNLGTFLLSRTNLMYINGEPNCFKLKSVGLEAQFCKLDSGKGDFVTEWDYDFNLFKNQCRTKRPVTMLSAAEEMQFQQEEEEQVSLAKSEIVHLRENALKKKVEAKTEKNLAKKVENTEQASLMAMQKEFKLEEMLQKEEEMREVEETKVLEKQIEDEKQKDDCLMDKIKEKEMEDQFNLSKSEAESSIANVKAEAQQQIQTQRAEIKKKIELMRKRNDRKKKALQSQLMSLRTVVAEKLQKVSKSGSMDSCFAPNTNGKTAKDIENYCNRNFVTDISKHQQCNDESSFCYVCCENEFGEVHVKDRDQCYNKCDVKTNNPGKDANKNVGGSWKYVPSVN